jgi:hypothetical protein
VPGIDKTENSYKQDPAPGLAAAPRRSAAYRHIADLTPVEAQAEQPA